MKKNIESISQKYNRYVEAKIPKTKLFPSVIYSYLVGGAICMFGQGIFDLLQLVWPSMSNQDATAWMLIVLIFIASLLTGLGIYDRIGYFAGGGSIVPITGFSNSITSPAMEFKREGIIFGVCVKMFTVAGPVIVMGTILSFIVGIIYFIF